MLLEEDFYNLKPSDCEKLSFAQSVELLIKSIGEEKFEQAKSFKIKSPLQNEKTSEWIKKTKIIGINPHIVKTYWGIVKYALSFPEKGIHLMPLFESGDGSLYVQNSWRLNPDFYDRDLDNLGFDTCEKQLKFVVNILHSMGKYVVQQMLMSGADLVLKDNFISERKGIIKFSEQTREVQDKLIKENPLYGNIICRCETITEAEILDAIHRPLGARTVDAVKRRVRAGMGRCQAGFCGPKVIEILARELGVSTDEINKNIDGSYMVSGTTR